MTCKQYLTRLVLSCLYCGVVMVITDKRSPGK
jgi:hypothetical protein